MLGRVFAHGCVLAPVTCSLRLRQATSSCCSWSRMAAAPMRSPRAWTRPRCVAVAHAPARRVPLCPFPAFDAAHTALVLWPGLEQVRRVWGCLQLDRRGVQRRVRGELQHRSTASGGAWCQHPCSLAPPPPPPWAAPSLTPRASVAPAASQLFPFACTAAGTSPCVTVVNRVLVSGNPIATCCTGRFMPPPAP